MSDRTPTGRETIANTVLLLPAVLFGGWAFSLLWAWYAVPLGAPRLTIGSAAGLLLLFGFIMGRRGLGQDTKPPLEWFLGAVFSQALFLIVGWLVRAFV